MRERAAFLGGGHRLLGVVTDPQGSFGPAGRVGVLLLNAGLLHRVGPNRLYVELARRLAAGEALAARFDFSGIGDSPPREDTVPFDEFTVQETGKAMDYLASSRGLERFVLVGVCSGADVAFHVACREPRAAGVVAINGTLTPSGQDEAALPDAATSIRLRYYRKRFLDPRSWLRVLTGRSDYRALIESLASRSKAVVARGPAAPARPAALDRVAELLARDVRIFLAYSEGSQAFDLFRWSLQAGIERLKDPARLKVAIIQDVDHVFTLCRARQELIDMIDDWMGEQGWLAHAADSARIGES